MANRLVHETSPYLLQHAHNPVNWWAWSEEALATARREDKPIFLSIGYAACHWCHVMERESFENPAIAELLNRDFISIKVDREERPDLDQVYMQAVMAMRGGQGGWPLSAFLTPEGHAFFGGTYWPPRERMGMPGFDHVLQRVAAAWREQRSEVLRQSQEVTAWLHEQTTAAAPAAAVDAELLGRATDRLYQSFDFQWGGFGDAPKFPHSMHLDFLLRAALSGDLAANLRSETAREMVRLNLDAMAYGGMYDHLGGGFARYSVDERWLVPHFEKMLYDNALLAPVYCNFYRQTGQPRFAAVARETLDYLLREMRDAAGGFHSSEDADSEGEEGKFYVWSKAEIEAELGSAAADFCRHYGVSAGGNFEGHNILFNPRLPKGLSLEPGEELNRELQAARARLLEVRSRRVRPGKDDKILTSWNALAISALATGAMTFAEPRYHNAAREALRFLLFQLRDPEGRLLHAWREGIAKQPGFLDDYSYLLTACLDLYEVECDESLVETAQRLADELLHLFSDPAGGALFYTANDAPQLITRLKDQHDSSLPSGNSAAACGLLRLAQLTGLARYRQRAEQIIAATRPLLERAPLAVGQMLVAAWKQVQPNEELVLLTANQAGRDEGLRLLHRHWLPQAVFAVRAATDNGSQSPRLDHLFQGRECRGGQPTLYHCRGNQCLAPVIGSEAIEQYLADLSSGALVR
ncbi:MAG: thioredoxin domain-containing protein [Planctomycetota bacterium]